MFFRTILSFALKKRITQIERFVTNPHEIQSQILFSLLKKAKNTTYGKRYDFKSIASIETFKSRLPIVTYNELYPEIEQILKGKQNVLWPTDIKWFAKSSGTTNDRSKYIPVSVDALNDCHFKAGKDLLALYLTNYPDSKIFSGKGITLGGTVESNKFDISSQSKIGDVSAVLLKNLPWWAEKVRTPPLEVAIMEEWEKKIFSMVNTTIKENVTNISGVPTWVIVLLKEVLKKSGKDNISEVWPNLEVFFHGAVSFAPYQNLFHRLIPSDSMRYMEVYNATEGFFGIQDQKHSKEMLLMLDYGIYYEFIPQEEIQKENPSVLGLEQVEKGKSYEIIITTNSGLWRYRIGDTVMFTSTNPYRITISGRTKHFINAFGEELMIDDAEKAIAYAAQQTGAEINNYTVAPIFPNTEQKGRHEWLIEFSKHPKDIEQFNMILDQKLREVNSDYDAKRYKDIAMQLLVTHVAKKDTFYEWLKRKKSLGGQHKVPRLSNSRENIEALLKINQEK